MNDMQRRMDELFGRSFGFAPAMRWPVVERLDPAVDVFETDDKVIAFAALPGYSPDNIRVEATADTLSIQGERSAIFEDEKATVHRCCGLTGAGQFSVSYTLPVEIDPDKVKASFNHGILKIELPKAEHARPKGVKVAVGTE
jgi:HSP20 family protein